MSLRVPEEDDEGGPDGAHCCCLGDEKTGIVSRVCPALTIFVPINNIEILYLSDKTYLRLDAEQ